MLLKRNDGSMTGSWLRPEVGVGEAAATTAVVAVAETLLPTSLHLATG